MPLIRTATLAAALLAATPAIAEDEAQTRLPGLDLSSIEDTAAPGLAPTGSIRPRLRGWTDREARDDDADPLAALRADARLRF